MIDDEFMNNAAEQSFVLGLGRHFTSGTSTLPKNNFHFMSGLVNAIPLTDNDRRFAVYQASHQWDDIRMRWMRNPDYRPTVRGVYGRHAMAPNYPYFDGRLK